MGENHQPLVSVGIPTFNRPEGLEKTLECISRQTYSHLEIIVSDNASNGTEVKTVLEKWQNRDPRIQFFIQEVNQGPQFNFQFVLEKARGEYFMWAADDDHWSVTFVEDCMSEFQKLDPSYVAVALESQYSDGETTFPYFSEGTPFYHFKSDRPVERMKFVLEHNFGNLFYSVFKREALFRSGKSFFQWVPLKSQNEIPLFLFVANSGNWKVVNKVGLFKTAPHLTYLHARWEMQGGRLPKLGFKKYVKEILSYVLIYHLLTHRDIFFAIQQAPIQHHSKIFLNILNSFILWKHFLHYVLRVKRPAFEPQKEKTRGTRIDLHPDI